MSITQEPERESWGPVRAFTPPPPWTAHALCAETDPEAFFPEKGGSTSAAKSVCGDCTVRAECLTWALTSNERFGVWGGLSERERRHLLTPTDREDRAS